MEKIKITVQGFHKTILVDKIISDTKLKKVEAAILEELRKKNKNIRKSTN